MKEEGDGRERGGKRGLGNAVGSLESGSWEKRQRGFFKQAYLMLTLCHPLSSADRSYSANITAVTD